MISIPQYDESRLPVGLGSPLRVPHYAWPNWGVVYENEADFQRLVALSERCYREEWDLTTEQGHRDIREASRKAGFDNFPLNEENARVAARVIGRTRGRVKILDIGAGSGETAIQILNALEDHGPDRLHFSLIDPAEKALEEARIKLGQLGLEHGKNFETLAITDLGLAAHFDQNTFDLVTAVASIHHHAYLTQPFCLVYEILKPGGFFLTSDWHNSMWEHPARVFELLDELDWDTKESDLNNFLKTYPESAIMPPGDISQEDIKANEMVKSFWRAYAKLKSTENSQFLILEGHRPVSRYLEEMEKTGFETASGIFKSLWR